MPPPDGAASTNRHPEAGGAWVGDDGHAGRDLHSSSAPARASARSAPSARATPARARRRPTSSPACSPRGAAPARGNRGACRRCRPARARAALRRRASSSRASSSATSTLVANSASSCFSRSSFGVEPGLAQPRAQLLDVGRVDRRNARRDARHLRFDVGAALEQHVGELGAFARARRRELARARWSTSPITVSAAARSGATVGSISTPGQRRISATDSGAAPGHKVPSLRTRPSASAATRVGSTAIAAARAGGARERDAALDLAALQGGRESAPAAPFRARATRPAA